MPVLGIQLGLRKGVGGLPPPPFWDGVRHVDLIASVAVWDHVVHASPHRVGEDVGSVKVELYLLALAFLAVGRFTFLGRRSRGNGRKDSVSNHINAVPPAWALSVRGRRGAMPSRGTA